MKYLIIPILLLISACAATSEVQPTVGPQVEIVPYIANKELVVPIQVNLFSEAYRCQGIVKYQAEVQNDKMRSRLTCEWEVEPDDWSNWE